jgi:hypothetical protein
MFGEILLACWGLEFAEMLTVTEKVRDFESLNQQAYITILV